MICIGCKYYDAEHIMCRNKKARYVGCDECFKWEKKKPTNADRIRAMSDEELANMWVSYVDCGECPAHRECNMLPQDCLRLALEWLKKEVDENG